MSHIGASDKELIFASAVSLRMSMKYEHIGQQQRLQENQSPPVTVNVYKAIVLVQRSCTETPKLVPKLIYGNVEYENFPRGNNPRPFVEGGDPLLHPALPSVVRGRCTTDHSPPKPENQTPPMHL